MRAAQFAPLLAAAATMFALATPAHAQFPFLSRQDMGTVGGAVVAQECAFTSAEALSDATKQNESNPLTAVAVGLVGDVVSAGADALSRALEEASRERTYAATGQASFAFYGIDVPGVDSATSAVLQTLPAGKPTCLIFAVGDLSDQTAAQPLPAPVPSGESAGDAGAVVDLGQKLARLQLPRHPRLFLEAVLEPRADGFVVRPVSLWYREALPSAPDRALPAELHVTFSTPAAQGDAAATGAIFAVARIPLPRIQPGAPGPLDLTTLGGYSSVVLPARPRTGRTEEALSAFRALQAERVANETELRVVTRLLGPARTAAAAGNATGAIKAVYQALLDREAEARHVQTLLEVRAASLPTAIAAGSYGSSNVQVRFVLVRDANRFGMAVAAALKARAPAMGQAVTTLLTPDNPLQAWTQLDTAYVTAQGLVQTRLAELTVAQAGGVASTILTAQLALQNAQALANAAAAASGRSLPYPGLIP